MTSAMRTITLFLAPTSRVGKLWMALHAPLCFMAPFVGGFCAVAAIAVVHSPPMYFPDPFRPVPEPVKNAWTVAIPLALGVLPNCVFVVCSTKMERAAVCRRWDSPFLRAKTHCATMTAAAAASAIMGMAFHPAIIHIKETSLVPLYYYNGITSLVFNEALFTTATALYASPIALAAAITMIQLVYVLSRRDEDRWTENMFTLASRAEKHTQASHPEDDNLTEVVRVWSVSVQSWPLLKCINWCHAALLAAVGLCFVAAAVRIVGGAIRLAVTLPIYYFSDYEEWARFVEEPLLNVSSFLLGSQGLVLVMALGVFGFLGGRLLAYVREVRSTPELSTARILQPKFHLLLLAGTIASASFVDALPLPHPVIGTILEFVIYLSAIVALLLECVIVEQSADEQRYSKSVYVLTAEQTTLGDDDGAKPTDEKAETPAVPQDNVALAQV